MGTGQIDLVTWFTQPGTRAGLIRAFLTWAGKHHHLPADVGLPPTPRRPPPARSTVSKHLWKVARRLVTHDTKTSITGDFSERRHAPRRLPPHMLPPPLAAGVATCTAAPARRRSERQRVATVAPLPTAVPVTG
jgi:hypothetical protein